MADLGKELGDAAKRAALAELTKIKPWYVLHKWAILACLICLLVGGYLGHKL